MRFFLLLTLVLSASSLKSQNEILIKEIEATHGEQSKQLIQILTKTPYLGQGNPKVTKHPVSKEKCQLQAKKLSHNYQNPTFEKICGAKYMAPLYNPAKEKDLDAKSCIDQFEFPNIPCEYPLVWVRASEAAQICEAQGKRLCDDHEWEGACEGSLEAPDYLFELAKNDTSSKQVKLRRKIHNSQVKKSWAYGDKRKIGVCSANSFKSEGCNGGDFSKCGSNTYPAGFSLSCKSSLGVYDLHGNAAEHMNLPLKKSEISSISKKSLGVTEMKGSWFIFDKYKAHKDYCRWRAPYWHGSRVNYKKSHHNYHLGFRCCKDI